MRFCQNVYKFMSKNQKWEILAHEYVVSLFPVFMLPDGFIFMRDKKIAQKNVCISLKIENKSITWYFLPANWGQAHKQVVAKIKRNPMFLSNIFHIMESRGLEQIRFLQNALSADIRKLSN